MRITYAGHACFILEGSKKIIIDPMPLGENLKADITLLTHAHSDHLGDHPDKFGKTYASHELAGWLRGLGVDASGMNIGGSIETDGVTITQVHAEHSSSLNENGRPVYMGEACGYIISMDGTCIYHAGDTGLFSDMNLIREQYHPDIAMLPAGGTFTMGPAEAMRAAAFIGAPIVIPMHYNTFPPIRQDLSGFKKAIEATTSMQVELMHPGNELVL